MKNRISQYLCKNWNFSTRIKKITVAMMKNILIDINRILYKKQIEKKIFFNFIFKNIFQVLKRVREQNRNKNEYGEFSKFSFLHYSYYSFYNSPTKIFYFFYNNSQKTKLTNIPSTVAVKIVEEFILLFYLFLFIIGYNIPIILLLLVLHTNWWPLVLIFCICFFYDRRNIYKKRRKYVLQFGVILI